MAAPGGAVMGPAAAGGRAAGLVGFVHFRFVVEEGEPVLYVYELQLSGGVRGEGVGGWIMSVMEGIAREVSDGREG